MRIRSAHACVEDAVYAKIRRMQTKGIFRNVVLGVVPSEVADGKLMFTASVDGPLGARMLYEIVQSTEGKTGK